MPKPPVDHIPVGGFGFQLQSKPVIMSMPNHISLPDDVPFERRSKKRTVINRDVLIFFAGKDAVHSCRVLDVTNDGASIRLDGLGILPFEFAISFDHFRTMRKCRMIWRNGGFLGAKFES